MHETEGQLILNGSYDVGFTMELALKDLGFATALGRQLGVPLDLATMTEQTFMRGASAYGRGAQSTMIVTRSHGPAASSRKAARSTVG